MITLRPAPIAVHCPSRVDTLVLATGIVRQAEALLAAAQGHPHAVDHIEAAFDAALELTPHSGASDVRAAREHLVAAEAELYGSAHRLAV